MLYNSSHTNVSIRGLLPKPFGLEVLQISEISENSESAEVGDTVVGETSLITRSQERHRINICEMKLKQKSGEVGVESINCVKTTSPFQKTFEIHDVRKRIIEKVT